MAWRWSATMSHWRSAEPRRLPSGVRGITRRALILALMLAPLAACGRKGRLELPPEDEGDNPDEPGSPENPDTYGDPMTFPEPGEDEESAE
jgi:predicted small lipoprotein YifL